MKFYSVTVQMKAIVVLLILLYKVFLDLSLWMKVDNSKESYGTVLSCGTVYIAAQCMRKNP